LILLVDFEADFFLILFIDFSFCGLSTDTNLAWLFFLFHLPRKFMQDSLDLVSLMFSEFNFNASYSWITWLPINFAS